MDRVSCMFIPGSGSVGLLCGVFAPTATLVRVFVSGTARGCFCRREVFPIEEEKSFRAGFGFNRGAVDAAVRRRLRLALVGAKLFLASFTLGFVVFIGKLATGSLHLHWWMRLGYVLFGLLLIAWATKQVIYFSERLRQRER